MTPGEFVEAIIKILENSPSERKKNDPRIGCSLQVNRVTKVAKEWKVVLILGVCLPRGAGSSPARDKAFLVTWSCLLLKYSVLILPGTMVLLLGLLSCQYLFSFSELSDWSLRHGIVWKEGAPYALAQASEVRKETKESIGKLVWEECELHFLSL